ncbi:MAG: [Fe-Fe] hydrogenase large subunit C-terminal domain-containing protein [Candidatus Zixiibacteriota bacterium]
MEKSPQKGIVHTIADRCKRCYTCVRECPARAVKITGGQAVVLEDRCISCGHCVRVCSRNAKQVQDHTGSVEKILQQEDKRVIAIVAPSFPTFFPELEPSEKLIGAIMELGFDDVMEVGFGGDLVSREYKKLYDKSEKTWITSPCPAINIYIQKYMPKLVPNIANIVSPMVAMGRAIKWKLDPDAKVVFIGPCVAKKSEMSEPPVAGIIDDVLTFEELRKMLKRKKIDPNESEPRDFGGPHAYRGKLFPVSSGLLKTAQIDNDLESNDVLVAEGKDRIMSVLKSLQDGEIEPRFLDLLFCEGCVNGPFAPTYEKKYSNRDNVLKFYRKRMENFDKEKWQEWMDYFDDLDLRRIFSENPERLPQPSEEQIQNKLYDMGKKSDVDILNCGACGYPTCREHAIAVIQGLAESEMCLPYTVERLEDAVDEIKTSHNKLRDAQQQLLQNEKMAAMGQLAAGVAHEVNNPLGTILLYAHMLLEEMDDKDQKADDLKQIIDETNRCKCIVSDLLNFSRENRLALKEIDVNDFIVDVLKPFEENPDYKGIKFRMELEKLPGLSVDPDQIRQVLINVIQNAIDAIGQMGTLTVRTGRTDDGSRAVIEISDTGEGIPDDVKAKIFTPFFTTKDLGKGTGLGLSIAYGILKMHRGSIRAESEIGEGTSIIIEIPFGLGSSDIMMPTGERLKKPGNQELIG